MEIIVEFRATVSQPALIEFAEEFRSTEINVHLLPEDEYSNATGGEWDDVIVYLQQNSGTIISTFLTRASYDIFKFAIVKLWGKIVRSTNKKLNKGLSVRIDVQPQKQIRINIKGDISEETAALIIDRGLEYLKPEKSIPLFDNPRNVGSTKYEGESTVQMEYNHKTDKWEPHDFEAFREFLRKRQEEANDTFSG